MHSQETGIVDSFESLSLCDQTLGISLCLFLPPSPPCSIYVNHSANVLE